MTCSFSENACALLCGDSSEVRMLELQQLINNDVIQFNTGCSQVRSFSSELFSEPETILTNLSNGTLQLTLIAVDYKTITFIFVTISVSQILF